MICELYLNVTFFFFQRHVNGGSWVLKVGSSLDSQGREAFPREEVGGTEGSQSGLVGTDLASLGWWGKGAPEEKLAGRARQGLRTRFNENH